MVWRSGIIDTLKMDYLKFKKNNYFDLYHMYDLFLYSYRTMVHPAPGRPIMGGICGKNQWVKNIQIEEK